MEWAGWVPPPGEPLPPHPYYLDEQGVERPCDDQPPRGTGSGGSQQQQSQGNLDFTEFEGPVIAAPVTLSKGNTAMTSGVIVYPSPLILTRNLNPKPATLNPNSHTLNLKPYTLNPKP